MSNPPILYSKVPSETTVTTGAPSPQSSVLTILGSPGFIETRYFTREEIEQTYADMIGMGEPDNIAVECSVVSPDTKGSARITKGGE